MKRIIITIILAIAAIGSIYLFTQATQNRGAAGAIVFLCVLGIVAVNRKKKSQEEQSEAAARPAPAAKRPAKKPHRRGYGEEPQYQVVGDLRESGRSIAEIAHMLDITEDQVKNSLRYYQKKNE